MSPTTRNIKAFVFDAYGTLFDVSSIRDRCDDYDRFVSTLAAGVGGFDAPAPARAAAVAEIGHEYSLRLALPGTPRTRIICVNASGEAQARELALARCDGEWEILEVTG